MVNDTNLYESTAVFKLIKNNNKTFGSISESEAERRLYIELRYSPQKSKVIEYIGSMPVPRFMMFEDKVTSRRNIEVITMHLDLSDGRMSFSSALM